MKKTTSILFYAGVLFLLFLVGIGMRRAVFEAQVEVHGPDIPYTLESALHFRLIEFLDLFDRIPVEDPMVQYPDGVKIRETYSVGQEYVYLLLARLLPASSISLAERIRWVQVAWFCLGIPLMGLWIGWWTRKPWGGIVSAAFYAVALSSVIRSTGQELSRENFALPLLIGHLAFMALAGRGRARWPQVVSALLLAVALMTWDLIQFYVYLFVLIAFVRFVRGGYRNHPADRVAWFIHLAALLIAGLANPYLRAHLFLLSPAMLMAYGIGLGLVLDKDVSFRSPISAAGLRAGMVFVVVAAGVMLFSGYHETYGHFTELLWGKLRFLNSKPADPSLLTFNQRIMWVPALDSANLDLTKMLFPGMLLLTFLAVAIILIPSKASLHPGLVHLIFFYCSSLIAYWFFVRFHVFLALFSAGLIGWLAVWAWERGGWKKWLVSWLVLVVLGVEAVHVLDRPHRWGRPGVYYEELKALTSWLDKQIAPEPILADFGVSSSILAYGRCPVILHPKFEKKEIRERVEGYGQALFKGTEETFRDWAESHGARYYVHSQGQFYRDFPELQMRYFVDALTPAPDAPARIFEFKPDTAKYFKPVWSNRKYKVFKILTRTDEALAADYVREAQAAFERGNLDLAEQEAALALGLDPDNQQALELFRHIGSLRDQGFSHKAHEED